MHKLFTLGLLPILWFAAAPSSTNYTLRSYDVGTGGNSSSSSTNYGLNGISGAQSGNLQSSTNYAVVSGVNATQNAHVPPAPTFTNPSNYYDRLKLVLNVGSDPSDTKYLIAISTVANNFATPYYVQTTNAIGSSLSIANYQSYASWGGASGFTILGLSPSTSYLVKVAALQGNFTGSAYGPTASAATIGATLTMSLATTLTSTPPFPVTFSGLVPGTVTNGNADAVVGFTSNANNGGTVYVKSTNAGLLSASTSTNIASASTNLTAATSGYGAQVTTVSQTSGGPVASASPFNGTANNVGGLTTALQPILSTTAPVTSASGTVRLMAKVANITPSANDYSDAVTFVIAMNF